MSLFQDIRAACREVAENATFVRIDRARIPSYAISLAGSQKVTPVLDPTHHFLERGEDTLAFVVTLNTINFGSGWFPHLKKRPGLSGYFTIASALTELFRSEGPLSPERLARIGAVQCADIFGQQLENEPVRELMERFATALNNLGSLLLDRYHGRFAMLVEDAEESAERLVGLLRAMPFFDDAEQWRGRRVRFYKRAQLLAADLAVAFKGQRWGRFGDLAELTIFADNLIPHVLRLDGVLRYDPDLAARIDRQGLIEAGSPQEVEIRAGALHAVELMVEELRRAGRAASAMELDYLLWNRGQRVDYKRSKPRHRTRTVFY